MNGRINLRHLLRDVVNTLDRARCPECGRAFDAEAARETNCHHMVPLNCSWCSTRLQLLNQYAGWLRQDQEVRDTPTARAFRARVHADLLRRAREYVAHEYGDY